MDSRVSFSSRHRSRLFFVGRNLSSIDQGEESCLLFLKSKDAFSFMEAASKSCSGNDVCRELMEVFQNVHLQVKAWFAILRCTAHFSPSSPTSPLPNSTAACGLKRILSNAPVELTSTSLMRSGSDITNRGFEPNQYRNVLP